MFYVSRRKVNLHFNSWVLLDFDAVEFQPSAISTNSNSIGALWYTAFVTAIHEIVIEQLRPKFKFPAKIQMAFSQILAVR